MEEPHDEYGPIYRTPGDSANNESDWTPDGRRKTSEGPTLLGFLRVITIGVVGAALLLLLLTFVFARGCGDVLDLHK